MEMPTVEENIATWEAYDWPKGGDEWSWEWGGPHAQWNCSLLPRIYRWLPAGTILEIAPGFGRWTQYLKDCAEHLIIVDLSEKCIAACRERFAEATNISFHVNDGRTLGMIRDGTVDFAVSFDSLVHVEVDAIESYIAELSRVLTHDGVAFLHHSNLGAHLKELELGRRTAKLPGRLQFVSGWLERTGRSTRNLHVRAKSVSADLVAELCNRHGLQCVAQEVVNWGGPILHDCFTAITPVGSRWSQSRKGMLNPDFMAEVARIAGRERLYPH
jgi:SAM-dependent methyltransferase